MTLNKKKKILIFRTDRIGDLINCSPFLKSLKIYYKNSEITLICSNCNKPVAETYHFIDKVIAYDKSLSFFKKFKVFFKLITSSFDVTIAFDGKKISYLTTMLVKSKQKYIVSFKKEKKFLGQKFYVFRPLLILCKIFFDTYIICDEDYSKVGVNSEFSNHYLSMFYYLLKKNHIDLIPQKHIFIVNSDSKKKYDDFYLSNINDNFLLMHIDLKWENYDINIDKFNKILKNISSNNKLVITCGKEGSSFFSKLKNSYNNFLFKNDVFLSRNYISKINNIVLLENLSLNLLACFIKNSLLFINSHSGAPFHISVAMNTPIVDFIKKEKELEYNRWIPFNIDYERVFINDLDQLESLILKKFKISI